VTELFRRYHGLIRELATRGAPEVVWRADLQKILHELDHDCRDRSRHYGTMLREELSSQTEHELLCCADPDARVILGVALKHLEAEL
jgi:hypothetical protein